MRDKLEANTRFYREGLVKAGLTIRPGTHPIVPIMLGDAALAEYEGPRMAELRMAAIGDRFSAELESGQDAALVGDLRATLARHPLRERLVALLMLALHRSGRRAEALELYRRTHRRLR